MELEKGKRIDWIDCVKGLAIAIVVIGHSCIPAICKEQPYIYYLYLWINAINMPVFFFLSGYVSYKKYEMQFTEFLKKKVRRLLIPYFIYSFCVYCIIAIGSRVSILHNLLKSAGYGAIPLKSAIIQIALCWINLDKHLWFIWVLFIIYILRYALYHIKIKLNVVLSISFLFLIISILIFSTYRIVDYDLAEFIFKIFYYNFFFVLGEFIAEGSIISKVNISKFKYIDLNIFFVVSVVYLLIYSKLNLTLIWIYKFIIGASSLYVFYLSSMVMKKFHKAFERSKVIGTRSFEIYLLHQPFIVSGTAVVLNKLDVPFIISIITASIVGVLIPLLITDVFDVLRRNLRF